MKRPIAQQVRTAMNAAAERIRTHARQGGCPEAMRFLDRIDVARNVFVERAKYIDLCTEEAQRIGDSQRQVELREMHEELVRDLKQFQFLAETGMESLTQKADA